MTQIFQKPGRSGRPDGHGQPRGSRVAFRGRGGGRLRATKNINHFQSTRIEDKATEFPQNNKTNSNSGSERDVGDETEPSSDSDNEIQGHNVQPYNSLLQAINLNSQHDMQLHKKRKLNSADDAQGNEKLQEDDAEAIEEPQDVDDLGLDDFEVDEQGQTSDPFLEHLDPDSTALEKLIQAVKTSDWLTSKSSQGLQFFQVIQTPQVSGQSFESSNTIIPDTESLFLKKRLQIPAKKRLPDFDELARHLAFSIFNYRDMLFSHRTPMNSAILRDLACLHAVNHMSKTRDKVIKDNARLTKENFGEDLELRDQGFTRPKVLILLPTRHSCVRYIEALVSFYEPEQQENKKRFQDSYASGEQVSEDKPEDFRELFDGNDDDMFRLGLKFTRKTVKFFAHFYNSDIILASPLGLRMVLGADDPKKQDNDFLSSIEVLVMDQADAISMQNWEHITYIFDRLNLQPKEAHGCDFSRVRNWYLDGNARHLRQTILISAFNFPSLNRLYAKHSLNVAGRHKYARAMDGAITDLGIPVKQIFSRFDCDVPVMEPEKRFEYFTSVIIPSLTKLSRQSVAGGVGVLIYLPSYVDFVRVRNFMAASSATQDISFGSISEYTNVRDVARARSHFLSGRHSVLLYTERAHHFRRYHLKGVKRVILYGLPENPIFYKEVVAGFLGASIAVAQLDTRQASVKAMFSKLDILKLERMVGSRRYPLMLKEKRGDTFEFI